MGQQQQIQPFDFHRFLIGEAPGWFLIEIAIRMALIYLILMVAMRLMGKRLAGQMSLSEMAVIVTLGAAGGGSLQAPGRGLLGPPGFFPPPRVFSRGPLAGAFRGCPGGGGSRGGGCALPP